MIETLVTSLLWFAAVGCGMLAGLYFAFSSFIMTALGRIDQTSGVAAMNAINTVIQRSPFMPLFLGTSLASLALALVALFRWREPGALAMLCGGVIYFVGMFLVTMLFNVPLNNRLAAVTPTGGTELWARYLKDWTAWNHVRTIASTAASALFIASIAAS